MLVLVVILVVYIILRDLLPRTHPSARHAPKCESLGVPQDANCAGRGASRVEFSDAVRPLQVILPVKQDKVAVVHATVPSTSCKGQSRGGPRVTTTSASQPAVALPDANASAPTVAPVVSLSSPSPSFVGRFADLKVNTTQSRLASSARSGRRGRTLSLSPLSTPPSTPPPTPPHTPAPFPSARPSHTPVGSHGRAPWSLDAVDFSQYKKKTRILTKSPQKPQTKAAGKLRAGAAADATTVTAWFYKLSTNAELLVVPPDLTGHPENLSLGDLYFDSARGVYQLWLWCSDDGSAPHWKKIPIGYQRDDGKHLIMTRKNHLLSWVTLRTFGRLGAAIVLPLAKVKTDRNLGVNAYSWTIWIRTSGIQ